MDNSDTLAHVIVLLALFKIGSNATFKVMGAKPQTRLFVLKEKHMPENGHQLSSDA